MTENHYPNPDNLRPELDSVHIAPRNETEKLLVRLWEQFIGVKNIGVLDNYFELGGDSIASLQIATKARQNGINLKPEHLFNYQNIAEISRVIQSGEESESHFNNKNSDESVYAKPFELAQLKEKELKKLLQTDHEIKDIYPLSPMQKGMFFNQLYDPNSDLGIELISCRLDGQIDVDALQKAWEMVIERHPILRTKFIWENISNAQQAITDSFKSDWENLDFSNYSDVEKSEKLSEILAKERRKIFNLTEAPLMRIKLIKLDAERHHFIWTHHHLLLDGWSVPLVLGEVFLAYEAFRSNQSVDLPPVTPYRNYIQWLESQDLDKARHYWQSVLKNGNRATELPKSNAGNETTANGNSSSGEIRLRLSEAESERVKRFAQRQKVTVNTIMQGAWAMVLSGYSGEEEVQFGATVSGRPAELEGAGAMVGLFINTLPVRIKLEMEAEVGDWLRRLQTAQTRSREYEYSPLTEIRKWTEVKAEDKLFESILVFENYPMDEALRENQKSLKVSEFEYIDPPQSEMLLMIIPGEQILIRLMYSEKMFSEDFCQNLCGELQDAVLSIVENDNVKIKNIGFINTNTIAASVASQLKDSIFKDEFSF